MKQPRRKSPVSTITTETHHCSIEFRLKILSRLPFFAGLHTQALRQINQYFGEVGYHPGDLIYQTGDQAERLYVVAEGKVKLLQHTAGGHTVLLDILTSGEFFGNLSALGTAIYPDTAQAQTNSCVLSIPSDSFEKVLDAHPRLALKSMEIMAKRLEAANQRVAQLSSMSVDRRIAVTLLALAKKFGRKEEMGLLIDVPLSRDEVAEMTGTTPETVSRVLSQFENNGIIESGRLWIAITDLTALESLIR